MEYNLNIKRFAVESRHGGNQLVVHLEGTKAGGPNTLEGLLNNLDGDNEDGSPGPASAELTLRFRKPWPLFTTNDSFILKVEPVP